MTQHSKDDRTSCPGHLASFPYHDKVAATVPDIVSLFKAGYGGKECVIDVPFIKKLNK